MLACLILAACASTPSARAASAGPGTAHAHPRRPMLPGPGGAVPPDAIQRPGGYYLDDGPGEGPPVDPANVPDAVPRAEAPLPNANRPYEALGEVYFPDTSSLPFSERGLASWYGRRFHGRRTSSGEPYDMYAMTGAHKTLPIPSYARVTEVLTGKSVVVRINDRGPFHPGRVIDLSYTAASKLGYAGRGSTEVVVERVFPAGISDQPQPTLASAGQTGGPPAATTVSTAVPTPERPADPPPVASPPGSTTATVAADETRGAAKAMSETMASAAPERPAESATHAPTPAALPGPAPATSAIAGETPSGALDATVQRAAAASSGGAAGALFLQLGAFRSADNARRLLSEARSRLRDLGRLLRLDVEGELSRVRLGPFPSAAAQNAAAAMVERTLHLKPGLIGP